MKVILYFSVIYSVSSFTFTCSCSCQAPRSLFANHSVSLGTRHFVILFSEISLNDLVDQQFSPQGDSAPFLHFLSFSLTFHDSPPCDPLETGEHSLHYLWIYWKDTLFRLVMCRAELLLLHLSNITLSLVQSIELPYEKDSNVIVCPCGICWICLGLQPQDPA